MIFRGEVARAGPSPRYGKTAGVPWLLLPSASVHAAASAHLAELGTHE
ncbi:hypothetical protein [Sphingomonas sp. R1]|nr:hypothetical protein [Sphingomonas sp. R1]UYY77198.1 hypothetical protein OIM94_17155 [Sphingomonas sp. R1]